VVVYIGPTRTPAQLATLGAEPEAADPVIKKKAAKHKPATAKAKGGASSNAKPADGAALLDGKSLDGKSADGKSADGKAADGNAADGKVGVPPWTPMSSSALAASPPPDLRPDSPAGTTAQAKAKPAAAANFQQ
jgi:hypothetical protein